MEMYFFKNFSENLIKKREKVFFNSITGKNIQLLYISLEPGESTNHCHTNEQMGYILSGEAEIIVNGEKQICKPGDAYFIPANAKHEFKVINEKKVDYIEVFTPPKKENTI
jgi:quercetin dioxygenase-like cupin family protein